MYNYYALTGSDIIIIGGSMMNQKMNLVELSKASTFFNIGLNVFEIHIIKEFIDIEKMWVE